MKEYTLKIPEEVERKLRRCRASIRESIRKRLQKIVEAVTARSLSGRRAEALQGPPMRFYVFEGYRITYEVNQTAHSVRVLECQAEFA